MTNLRDKMTKFVELSGLGAMGEALTQSLVTQFRDRFETGLGEVLPKEPAEALALVEKTLRDGLPALKDKLGAIYEKHLDESEIDALIAYHESPIGQKIRAIGLTVNNDVVDETEAWQMAAMKSIETDLARILG